MSITAGMVKELRERTGAGMMECKRALVETNGDIEAAIEAMRKSGLAKADKKSGRVAAEGMMVIRASADKKRAVMVDVNCETDFVAKGDDFQQFANAVADCVLANQPADLDALYSLPLTPGGQTVDEVRRAFIAKIGENMAVRRFTLASSPEGVVGCYLHGTRIGVMVELVGGTEELAKDVAMHVAASRPVCVSEEQVSPELIAKEREIFKAQAKDSGKPDNIIDKMVDGRVKKFLAEVTLVGQPFVKDPEITVAKLLQNGKATVKSFCRMEVGEGIEKLQTDFVAEVMAQAQGS